MIIEPRYKFRYAAGLGDIIACILHMKYIGRLVDLIKTNKSGCSQCSQRAEILNLFFPVPIWKFYFKNIEERNSVFLQEMENLGYNVDFLKIQEELNEKKCNCNQVVNDMSILESHKIDYIEYDGYFLKSKEESNDGEYKVLKFTYIKK